MAYETEDELIQSELEDELSGQGEFEDEYETESSLEGEGWLGAIGNVVGSLLGEGEAEDEYEDESAFESEAEDEISPIRKIYPDAMMEHMGALAAEAETEDEAAEHFLPLIGMAASKLLPVVAKAVAPMAKKALPKMARAVMKTSPRLTQGIGRITKTLHRNPQTRHLVKAVPTIARRTVGSIARQAVRGRPITPRTAVRTLARQTRHVLGHPQHRRRALQRHNRLERTFHRRYGRGTAQPHGRRRYGRYAYGYGQASPVYGTSSPGGVPTPVGSISPGATSGGPVRYGQVAGGQCSCGQSAASPAYCRCCGQVLR